MAMTCPRWSRSLKDYVRPFGDDVVALRGTLEQTQAVARDFKVYFAKVPGKPCGLRRPM